MSNKQTALRLVTGTPELVSQIEHFLDAKQVYSDKTVAFYRTALSLYLDHVGDGHWPPTDSGINGFLAAARKRGCKDNTIHAYYRAVKTWCTWLHKRGKIERNPMDTVEAPPRQRKIPRAPRPDTIERLFGFMQLMIRTRKWHYIRDLALMSVALDSGMRIGELSALNLEDVDMTRGTLRLEETKTNWDRVVVIHETALADLARWMRVRNAMDVPREIDALFTSFYQGNWRRLTGWGIRQAFIKRLRQAEVGHFRFHDLRHAYAIYTLRNGGDLLDVQRQLGHKNLATTAIYTLVDDDGRRERHARTSPRSNLP